MPAMRFPLPAASSLNFVAGILAGAGINLVTTAAIAGTANVSTAAVAVDAVSWVLAAAFLYWAAQTIQRGEREADRDIGPRGRLTDDEARQIRDHHERRAWRRARLPMALTVVALAGALAVLPSVVR